MKLPSLTSTLLMSLLLSSHAEPARAVITMVGDGSKEVYINAASDKGLAYLETPSSTSPVQIARSKVDSIFFYRPSTFHNGLEAYNDGKFSVAAAAFEECKKTYDKIKKLPQNYGTLAAFYELECARRERRFDDLDKLLNAFRPDALVNENQLAQLQIYPFWQAYAKKDWKRLNKMITQWGDKKLPGYQRAQVAFCYGMALKETGEVQAAKDQFNKVLVLSEYKEMELVIDAGEQLIELTLSDQKIQDCLASQGKSDADTTSFAYLKLLEAASIARFWDTCESGKAFPSKYKKLLSIKRPAPVAAPEPAASEEE